MGVEKLKIPCVCICPIWEEYQEHDVIHDDNIPSEIWEYLVCLTCDRSWIFKTKILMYEVKIIDEG